MPPGQEALRPRPARRRVLGEENAEPGDLGNVEAGIRLERVGVVAPSPLQGVEAPPLAQGELRVEGLGQGHEEAVRIIEDLMAWPVIDNSLERFGHGLVLKQQFQISLWDAMILAAAQASGARELITEDLNSGQDYGGVVAVNPFA